jgi:hypothetical protein
MIILALWAFLEAIWWFIIVDVILIVLVVRRPEYAWRYATIAIAFSSLGIITHGLLTSIAPELSRTIVSNVPLLDAVKIARADALLDRSVFYALIQPFSGIPVKAWTIAADSWVFFPLVLCARALRMLLVTAIGAHVSRYPFFTTRTAFIIYAVCVTIALLLV